MHSLLRLFSLLVIFASASSGLASTVAGECIPRTAANVTLQDLEGVWYIMVFVNESDVQELRSCIKISYTFDNDKDAWREGRSSIPYGSKNVLEEHVYITMKDGVTDASVVNNGVLTTVHEVVTDIAKDDYFAITVCKKENGTKVDDRLALYARDRNMPRTRIDQILRSLGLGEDDHSYDYIRQENCPN